MRGTQALCFAFVQVVHNFVCMFVHVGVCLCVCLAKNLAHRGKNAGHVFSTTSGNFTRCIHVFFVKSKFYRLKHILLLLPYKVLSAEDACSLSLALTVYRP